MWEIISIKFCVFVQKWRLFRDINERQHVHIQLVLVYISQLHWQKWPIYIETYSGQVKKLKIFLAVFMHVGRKKSIHCFDKLPCWIKSKVTLKKSVNKWWQGKGYREDLQVDKKQYRWSQDTAIDD